MMHGTVTVFKLDKTRQRCLFELMMLRIYYTNSFRGENTIHELGIDA